MIPAADVISRAADRVGLSRDGAERIRDGSNVVYRLPGGVVARAGRQGHLAIARREVRAARWLADAGISVVRPLPVPQPTVVDEYPVTWWEEIPPHREATPAELGRILR